MEEVSSKRNSNVTYKTLNPQCSSGDRFDDGKPALTSATEPKSLINIDLSQYCSTLDPKRKTESETTPYKLDQFLKTFQSSRNNKYKNSNLLSSTGFFNHSARRSPSYWFNNSLSLSLDCSQNYTYSPRVSHVKSTDKDPLMVAGLNSFELYSQVPPRTSFVHFSSDHTNLTNTSSIQRHISICKKLGQEVLIDTTDYSNSANYSEKHKLTQTHKHSKSSGDILHETQESDRSQVELAPSIRGLINSQTILQKENTNNCPKHSSAPHIQQDTESINYLGKILNEKSHSTSSTVINLDPLDHDFHTFSGSPELSTIIANACSRGSSSSNTTAAVPLTRESSAALEDVPSTLTHSSTTNVLIDSSITHQKSTAKSQSFPSELKIKNKNRSKAYRFKGGYETNEEKENRQHTSAIYLQTIIQSINYRYARKSFQPLTSSKLRIALRKEDLEIPYEDVVECRRYFGTPKAKQAIKNLEICEMKLQREAVELVNGHSQSDPDPLIKSASEPYSDKIKYLAGRLNQEMSMIKSELKVDLEKFKSIVYKLLKPYISRPISISLDGEMIPLDKLKKRQRSRRLSSYGHDKFRPTESNANQEKDFNVETFLKQVSSEMDNAMKNIDKLISLSEAQQAVLSNKEKAKGIHHTPTSSSINASSMFGDSSSHYGFSQPSEQIKKDLKTVNEDYIKITLDLLRYECEARELQREVAETHQLRLLLGHYKLKYRHASHSKTHGRFRNDTSAGILSVASIVASYMEFMRHNCDNTNTHEISLEIGHSPIINAVQNTSRKNLYQPKIQEKSKLSKSHRKGPSQKELTTELVNKGKEVYNMIKQNDPQCVAKNAFPNDIDRIAALRPPVDQPFLCKLVMSRYLAQNLGRSNGKKLIAKALKRLAAINEKISDSTTAFKNIRDARESMLGIVARSGTENMIS